MNFRLNEHNGDGILLPGLKWYSTLTEARYDQDVAKHFRRCNQLQGPIWVEQWNGKEWVRLPEPEEERECPVDPFCTVCPKSLMRGSDSAL